MVCRVMWASSWQTEFTMPIRGKRHLHRRRRCAPGGVPYAQSTKVTIPAHEQPRRGCYPSGRNSTPYLEAAASTLPKNASVIDGSSAERSTAG